MRAHLDMRAPSATSLTHQLDGLGAQRFEGAAADAVKEIKSQLVNMLDVITKRLMYWKETVLTLRSTSVEEQPQVILQQPEPAVPGKRGRKRKLPEAQVSVPDLGRAAALEEDQSLDLPPPPTPGMPSPDHVSVSHLDADIPLGYSTANNLSVGMTPVCKLLSEK